MAVGSCRHLSVPEGWEIVTNGQIEKGDKIAEIIRAVWDDAESEGYVGFDVTTFVDGAVIRKRA